MSRAIASVALLLLLPISEAAAHTLMTEPQPRSSSDGLKSGPCGGVAPNTAVDLEAGSTITVRWLETVNHPGYYRIAFSQAGDAEFEQNILLDQIADTDCTSTPCEYSAEITLPTEPCEGCALQLIQFMGTQAPYSPYFSCADINIVAAGEGGGGPDAGPSGGGGTPPTDPTEAPELSGTCNAGGPSSTALLLLLLPFALCGRQRRQARRRQN